MQLSGEKITELLSDQSFIHWVLKPDENSNAYWQQWILQHPYERENLLAAKEILIRSAQNALPQNAEALSAQIWKNINAAIEQTKVVQLKTAIPKNYRKWYWVAACAVLIIASFLFASLFKINTNETAHKVFSVVENNQLKRTNATKENKVVYLVDGSKVTLQPGASIHYTTFFSKEKREIYLDGDAFFEVAKDAQHPFYVYEKNMRLRVLGTSFSVKANKKNGDVSVAVRTGRVSVFTDKNEMVLTQNQKALCKNNTLEIIRVDADTINKQPVVKPAASEVDFTFDDVPAGQIFSTLQDAYGIKINFDADAVSKCRITSSLNDESFENKLTIICKAISAAYYIKNNEVFISGGGCN